MQSLRFALQPAVSDVSVKWDLPKKVTATPLSPPITVIFQGQRLLTYYQLTGMVGTLYLRAVRTFSPRPVFHFHQFVCPLIVTVMFSLRLHKTQVVVWPWSTSCKVTSVRTASSLVSSQQRILGKKREILCSRLSSGSIYFSAVAECCYSLTSVLQLGGGTGTQGDAKKSNAT